MTKISKKLRAKIDDAKQVLSDIVSHYMPATFASSYGAEDMVLMDMIYKFAPDIEILPLIQAVFHKKPMI